MEVAPLPLVLVIAITKFSICIPPVYLFPHRHGCQVRLSV